MNFDYDTKNTKSSKQDGSTIFNYSIFKLINCDDCENVWDDEIIMNGLRVLIMNTKTVKEIDWYSLAKEICESYATHPNANEDHVNKVLDKIVNLFETMDTAWLAWRLAQFVNNPISDKTNPQLDEMDKKLKNIYSDSEERLSLNLKYIIEQQKVILTNPDIKEKIAKFIDDDKYDDDGIESGEFDPYAELDPKVKRRICDLALNGMESHRSYLSGKKKRKRVEDEDDVVELRERKKQKTC